MDTTITNEATKPVLSVTAFTSGHSARVPSHSGRRNCTAPRRPTATAPAGPERLTDVKSPATAVCASFHDLPLSLEPTVTPFEPTAQQFSLLRATALSVSSVPDPIAVHVPKLSVRRINPPSPTATA